MPAAHRTAGGSENNFIYSSFHNHPAEFYCLYVSSARSIIALFLRRLYLKFFSIHFIATAEYESITDCTVTGIQMFISELVVRLRIVDTLVNVRFDNYPSVKKYQYLNSSMRYNGI